MNDIVTTGDRQLIGLIRTIRRAKLIAPNARHEFSLPAVTPDAVVEIGGVQYMVAALGSYTELTWEFRTMQSGDKATEWRLVNLKDGSVRYFEWVMDDGIEAYLTDEELPKDPSCYGARSWQSFLADDELDSSLTITAYGETFRYSDEESWAARYQGAKPGAEFVRCYEFVSDRGNAGLTIESWGKQGEQGVSLWLSRPVLAGSLKLIAHGST